MARRNIFNPPESRADIAFPRGGCYKTLQAWAGSQAFSKTVLLKGF
jgi:hypothetical protein